MGLQIASYIATKSLRTSDGDVQKIDKLLSQTVAGTLLQLAAVLPLSYHAAHGSLSLLVAGRT